MDLQLTNLSGFFHILHLYRMNIFHINWKQQRIAKQRAIEVKYTTNYKETRPIAYINFE